ncbi:MAG: membrane protein insertase YidC, partial [Candidatus Glassbacteria bacterium]|nr:membrane protein insertase YidC [Candidatus Glassbacteria bacterium]
MEKRSAMAMGLIFLVWMVYFALFAPKPGPKPAEITSPGDSVTPVQVDRTAEKLSPGDPAAEEDRLLSTMAGEDAPGAPEEAVPVDTVVVTSDLYNYYFVTRGGILVRAYLKEYPDFSDKPASRKEKGAPVQLIPTRGSRFLASCLFFSNQKTGRTDSVDLAGLDFKTGTTVLTLDSLRSEGSVTFTRELQGGRQLKLVYLFRNDSYKIDVNLSLPAELRRSDEDVLEVVLGPTLVSNEKNPKDDYEYYEIVYGEEGGSIIKKSLKDLGKSDWAPTEQPGILWGGIKNKYFLASFYVPEEPMVSVSASGSPETQDITFRGRFPVPKTDKPLHFAIYVGPQSYDQINRLNWGLEKILEYGWWIIQPFSKICLTVLLWMHSYIANYGLILIIFAVLVRVVFYPLTIKSTKSQIKMQQIQPLMNQLRDQYKDDPQKLQQETMRLYKEHKVNPLGGCLPLLVQMPVLIGLFYVFRLTIEFRGADAFWWVHDLSQPDPLHIWPVVMGLTTFLQQKLTPTQADPKMKPIMYIMPVFMTYIFWAFSSGLVMYYTFVNIIQIFQQVYIN